MRPYTPGKLGPGTARVFVYGTLLAGEANHGLLASSLLISAARTRATYSLYDFGPYPALVPSGTSEVVGELYQVEAVTLAALDRLEEHPEVYQRRRIALASGQRAWTYVMEPHQVEHAQFIPSGSWRQRTPLADERTPPLRRYPHR